ncbi:ergothioneine biosynthesis protein 1-like isoform X2 [Actinia tenebrosa]|uniref:Ergothioneine biosynthesis protein 1-like isoform X2 n=1 Tax=Actinia tenebrosa TaxID=6105 RepID=A0A6P8I4N1_ACTTE|nr:ergothioneine biosynthesis protein 1-like isoform X2 [Actinia tenebrosa]
MTSPFQVLSSIPCDLACLSIATMSDVRSYFENTYDLYENLFRGIKDEIAYFKYPDALRLPLIFYYGHTAAVYINKLMLAGLIEERVTFEYESLFETGVDEMSWDDTENFRMGGKFVWPSVSEVQKYRDDVKKTILKLIDTKPMDVPVTQDSPWWSLFMGMEHERIHFETSSVLIRQLPIEYVGRPDNWEYGPLTADPPVTKTSMLKVQNCTVTVGKPRDFPSYGWDNEYGEWTVRVPEFEASKYLVTNREFLEFVEAGGYENKTYWSDEGWKWRSFRKAKHPSFWVCNQACKSGCGNDLADYSHCCLATSDNDINGNEYHLQYKYRAIFDVIDTPLDWPAEVNYFEAKAYCAWKGPEYRLLTEAEHHAIRGPQKPVCMGTASDPLYQIDFKANINMKYASSTPVNMFPASETGFHDAFGNVWCWTEDQFNGLPGFETHYLYDDFSTPTFDGKHFVILGGSWASTGDEASRFARYAFRPHFFQHLGFRVVRSVNSTPPPVRLVSTSVYIPGVGVEGNRVQIPGIEDGEARYPSTNKQYVNDTNEFLQEELAKQYGDESIDPFTDLCLEYVSQCNCATGSALNLLCSVGRQAFELSKHFDEVLGIDYSGRLINAAQNLQKRKGMGLGSSGMLVEILEGANAERVTFKQLTWLPNEINKFDCVTFRGLDRLSCPEAWLARMREIVNPQGLVVIETSQNCDSEKVACFFGNRKKSNIEGNK